MKRFILLVAVVLFFSCSPQKKISRTYIGQPLSTMEAKFGKAKTVFDKKEGKEYIFEKVEYLKSTEISQHKLTLDPMVTPKATKTSRYYVTVIDGIISTVKLEEEYQR